MLCQRYWIAPIEVHFEVSTHLYAIGLAAAAYPIEWLEHRGCSVPIIICQILSCAAGLVAVKSRQPKENTAKSTDE